jgi:hypothetical protein
MGQGQDGLGQGALSVVSLLQDLVGWDFLSFPLVNSSDLWIPGWGSRFWA